MAKFDSEQINQLKELFPSKEWIERQFDERFDQQQKWLNAKFAEERVYYRQMIRDEVADIRKQLARIEAQIGGDATEALVEIDKLNHRVDELEAIIAKLQAA